MNINKTFLSDLENGFKSKSFERSPKLRSFLVEEKNNDFAEIASAFESAEISVYKRTILKEKLFMMMNINERKFDLRSLVQSFSAGAVAIALVFTSVLDLGGGIERANASSAISVSAVSGDVKVVRLGYELNVYPGFNITQSDRIKTAGGFVEMTFADNSVLRVNSNSEIVVDDLDIYSERTDSSMSIRKGSVWFNAFGGRNRLSEYDFKTSEMLVEVDDDSVLNVEVNDLFGQVSVFGESVEVNYKTQGQFQTSVLRKGDMIKVKKEQDSISVVDTVLLADDLESSQRTWFLENLKKDSIYRQGLAETSLLASKSKVGIRPDSLWYPLKEAQRATKKALTVDPVRKAEIELEIADEKLHEARILKVEGKDDLAQKTLDEYQENVSNVLEIASKVEKEDENVEVSALLKSSAKNLVETHKNEIIVEPNQKDELKDALLVTELKVAEASGDETKVKLKQLDEKIDELNFEIENEISIDIVDFEEKQEKIDEVVNDFKETVKKVSEEEEIIDEEITKLIEGSAKDLSEIVEEEDAPEIKDTIKDAVGIDIEAVELPLVNEQQVLLEQDVVKSRIEIEDLEKDAQVELEEVLEDNIEGILPEELLELEEDNSISSDIVE